MKISWSLHPNYQNRLYDQLPYYYFTEISKGFLPDAILDTCYSIQPVARL